MIRFLIGNFKKFLFELAWQWTPNTDNEIYQKILQMFQDRKSALYSIQTISKCYSIIDK